MLVTLGLGSPQAASATQAALQQLAYVGAATQNTRPRPHLIVAAMSQQTDS